MLTGLLIGGAKSFTVGYISSSYRDTVVFGLLIVLSLIRPHGSGERVPTRD
jgi:branched-subunit amino acid ABC-type transport system permease component